MCAFFCRLFALLFGRSVVLCIISSALRLLWSSTLQGVRTESAFSALFPLRSPCFAMVSALVSFFPPFLYQKWKMGTDERRQMTMSRPFSSSRLPGSPDRGFFDF